MELRNVFLQHWRLNLGIDTSYTIPLLLYPQPRISVFFSQSISIAQFLMIKLLQIKMKQFICICSPVASKILETSTLVKHFSFAILFIFMDSIIKYPLVLITDHIVVIPGQLVIYIIIYSYHSCKLCLSYQVGQSYKQQASRSYVKKGLPSPPKNTGLISTLQGLGIAIVFAIVFKTNSKTNKQKHLTG